MPGQSALPESELDERFLLEAGEAARVGPVVGTPAQVSCEASPKRKVCGNEWLTRRTMLTTAAVGAAGGAVAGWAVEFPVGVVLTPILGLLYGWLLLLTAARVLGRGASCQRGVLALSLVLSALIARMLVAWFVLVRGASVRPPLGVFYVLTDLFSPSLIPAVALAAIVVGIAVARRP